MLPGLSCHKKKVYKPNIVILIENICFHKAKLRFSVIFGLVSSTRLLGTHLGMNVQIND